VKWPPAPTATTPRPSPFYFISTDYAVSQHKKKQTTKQQKLIPCPSLSLSLSRARAQASSAARTSACHSIISTNQYLSLSLCIPVARDSASLRPRQSPLRARPAPQSGAQAHGRGRPAARQATAQPRRLPVTSQCQGTNENLARTLCVRQIVCMLDRMFGAVQRIGCFGQRELLRDLDPQCVREKYRKETKQERTDSICCNSFAISASYFLLQIQFNTKANALSWLA
jgi:hypothetical protein